MAHSQNNKQLRVGHRVYIPATITKITSDHVGTDNIEAAREDGKVLATNSSDVVLHPDERAADESFTPPIPNIMKSSIPGKTPTEEEAKAANRQVHNAEKVRPVDPVAKTDLPPADKPDAANERPSVDQSADEKADDDKLSE
jgi:hypothetical protein